LRASDMQRSQVVLRVELNIPATEENVEKLRSMLLTIDERFAERGMTRRARLFIGNSDERLPSQLR